MKEGELEVETGLGVVKFTKPVAYQEEKGKKKYVEVAYAVKGDEYRFKVEDYDSTKELVIDPLLASTFLGGDGVDEAYSIIIDSGGNVYVAGWSWSSDFPTTPGAYDTTYKGADDAFIAKFDGDLSASQPPNQPPTCAIELQKEGILIDNIDVGEFFDIYVGGSTDDQSIKEVRFSSDDSQDDNPTGKWTEGYYWDTSSGDWNAETKIKKWYFATGGKKEVWAEIQQIDGQNVVDKSASLDTLANSLDEIKHKMGESPTPLILYLVGHGIKEVFDFYTESDALSSTDLREMLEPFNDNLMLIIIGSCYSGSFITLDLVTNSISGNNRIIITAAHDDEKRLSALGLGGWYHSSDRFWGNLNKGLNVKDAFITNAWPGDRKHLWLDDNGDNIGHSPYNLGNDGALASATTIGVTGTDDLELTSWYSVWIHSAGEVRVYDSENRVTGLVNGEVKEEIPSSIYDEESEIVAIFSPSDTYRHEVAGTDEGTYGLDIASIEGDEATTFTATDIPTTTGATHGYTIDWDALSQGEEGVTVQVDSDGDGEFEQTFTADDELTQEEFLSATDTIPPEVSAEFIPIEVEEEEGLFEIKYSADDNCDPDPDTAGVILTPQLTEPEVKFHVEEEIIRLEYDLEENEVEVKGPDPEALWQEIQELGGLRVEDGQHIYIEPEEVSGKVEIKYED
jgi:hypothetical protein